MTTHTTRNGGDIHAEPLIEARALNAGYGSVTIVRDLNLQVSAGEIVALIGPNGAGKTTTLLTLSGQIPQLGGRIFFLGKETTAPQFRRARSGLGFVAEQRSILMNLTTLENFRVSRSDVELALEFFPELREHLERRVGLLSGGQQRMVALARILSKSPSLLLADELSLGLAPLIVDRLLNEVRAAAERGVGVLLVEQNMHKALETADRVLVMRRGRLQLSVKSNGSTDQAKEIRSAYFSIKTQS